MKDFNYYKKWAINHLKKQLAEESAVKKSLYFCEMMLQKSFPVGTIREWKGKKYKKVSPGKWMRYYNSQDRGSNQALRYAIKQLEKIEDMETLAKFINANRNRFCNEFGKPLPEAEEILKLGYEKAKDIKDLGNNVKRTFTEETRNKALEKINNPTDKMLYVEYTRENYNKLFPRGEIVTPIGKVKLSPHQFERLGEKDNGARKDYIGALFQTLSNPDVIIGKTDNRERYGKIFLKAFIDNNGEKSYLALVPTIDGLNIVVSNSPRDTKDIVKEIKKADHYYYINESALMTSSVSGGSLMRNPDEGQISNDSRNEKDIKPSNNSNLMSEQKIVNKKTVEIKLSDFPLQFSKGKWKKQTQLFLDCVNKQTQANPVIKNVLSKLGKVFNSELPFSIRNVVKKFKYLECFAVQVINNEEPVGQLLYFTPNFEVEDTVKGRSMILVHELTHMIDFSLREDKKKESFMGEQKEKLLSSILNAKISDYELEFLKEEVKRRSEERKVYVDDMIRLNNKLKELGNKYRKKEIDYETYDTEYDEIAKKYEEVKKQRDKFDGDHKALAQFCDIYDAISGGELYENENFPGHGKEYYSEKNKRVREILANIGSIGIFEPQYLNLLEKYQPEMMKEIYNYFNQIGE
ncbi:MAG: hypothetical protein MJ176_03350 [Treponema sp.]|nr:hypothetical protein [Treponema sp.]